MAATALVKASKLSKTFRLGNKTLDAVRDVSFEIYPHETLGLVGESGSGKSTVGRMLLSLLKPTSGSVTFKGADIANFSKEERKAFRSSSQIVFQDPYASLNPRMTVEEAVGEGMDIHGLVGDALERKSKIIELLGLVGLAPGVMNRFPHEFSGGQRQRISIARALAVNPEFLVCDEPISALDVSVQAQVVNLLKSLQDTLGLTYLFIAHDLAMVRYISDRVAVMYQGQIVELAPTEELFSDPQHPYTKSLLSAIPHL